MLCCMLTAEDQSCGLCIVICYASAGSLLQSITCCNRRRSRQGSTGWLSGSGWNRGSCACA